MGSSTRWPRDPKDKPAGDKAGEKLSGPLHTPSPIVDPGEADRAKLSQGAKSHPKGPEKGIPPD
jgi:hypothetical protein